METPPPNEEGLPPTKQLDQLVDRLNRWHSVLLFGFSATLVTLTWFHFKQLDAGWPTENVLLIFFACILASWYCRLTSVLSLTVIACIGWWLIDAQRDPDLLSCSVRHLTRSILMLSLVMVIGRSRRSLEEAQDAARIDVLTGLPNRRAIFEALEAELSRLRRFNRSFSIAMFDCDGFKMINDHQGHLAGDRALQAIAHGFRQQLRAYDCIGRLGGDEFLLILPETEFSEVSKIIDRLRNASHVELQAEFSSLTFSVGVVTVGPLTDSKAQAPDCITCLHQADQAMYAAKRAGRDHTVVVRWKPHDEKVVSRQDG